jgi:RNA polymerase sigma factor (sigma-70 family)
VRSGSRLPEGTAKHSTSVGHKQTKGFDEGHTPLSPDERHERFGALYDATRAKVAAYALRRTSSAEDAADVLAETYTIAWRRFDDVPAGDRSLLWLYATARRVAANSNRRVRRQDALIDRIAAEFRSVARADSPAGRAEELLTAKAALDRLGDDDRELLMLSGWEGLNSIELGRVLGCSSTAARIRLFRARSRFNALAGDEGSAKHGDGTRHLVKHQAGDVAPTEEAEKT